MFDYLIITSFILLFFLSILSGSGIYAIIALTLMVTKIAIDTKIEQEEKQKPKDRWKRWE